MCCVLNSDCETRGSARGGKQVTDSRCSGSNGMSGARTLEGVRGDVTTVAGFHARRRSGCYPIGGPEGAIRSFSVSEGVLKLLPAAARCD